MATGIPKTQSNGISKNQTTPDVPSDTLLQYEGKEPSSQILTGTRAEFVRLWPPKRDLPRSPRPNRLYYADNLSTLCALLDDSDVYGKVRLVYIDPPFATRSVFQSREQVDAYSD